MSLCNKLLIALAVFCACACIAVGVGISFYIKDQQKPPPAPGAPLRTAEPSPYAFASNLRIDNALFPAGIQIGS